MNVFAITATLVVTMDFPDGERLTQTRRIIAPGPTDYRVVAAFHKLGKQCCKKTPSVDELARAVERCIDQPPDRMTFYLGQRLCRSRLHRILRRHGGRRHLRRGVRRAHLPLAGEVRAALYANMLMFNLLCSFLAGVGTCATVAFVEAIAGGNSRRGYQQHERASGRQPAHPPGQDHRSARSCCSSPASS